MLSLSLRETSLGFFSEFFLPYVIISLLVGASGYLINGYLDQDIDKTNIPEYQFPLSKSQTYFIYLFITSLAIGVGLFSFSFKFTTAFVIFPILSLWLYSVVLKRLPLIGNLTIAFLSIWLPIGLLFVSGNLEDLNDDNMITKMTMTLITEIFVITFAREVIKDIQDIEGDRKAGCKTIPILIGEKGAAIIGSSSLIIGALIWFNFIHVNFSNLNLGYTILGIITLILLLFSIIQLWSKYDWLKRSKNSSLVIKIAMIFALLTVLFI